MSEDDESDDEDWGGSEYGDDDEHTHADLESRIDDLESKIEELEEGLETSSNSFMSRLQAAISSVGEVYGCVTKVAIVWVIGMALSVTISWELHHSILWAMVQGILSWIYVLYYWLRLAP